MIVQSQASIHGLISALSRPISSFEGGQGYSRSSWQKWMHRVVATGVSANGPTRIRISSRRYIWGHAEFQFSHQLVVISVLFSLREYRPHEKEYLSFFFFLLICIPTAIVWICNKRNISSSLDESAIFTQPRAKVTDVIATRGNFSSYTCKD